MKWAQEFKNSNHLEEWTERIHKAHYLLHFWRRKCITSPTSWRSHASVLKSAFCGKLIVMLQLSPRDNQGPVMLCETNVPKQTIKQRELEEKKHNLRAKRTAWERKTQNEHKANHDYLLVSFCLITAEKQKHLNELWEPNRDLMSITVLIVSLGLDLDPSLWEQ